MPQVRVLRILEYIGDQEDIERDLNRRSVKGEHVSLAYTIREGFVGEFPELLGKVRPEDKATTSDDV